MSTGMTTSDRPRSIAAILTNDEGFKAQVAAAMPRHMRPDRMMRVALTALRRTPKLAECTPESFMRCMLDLSAMGLEPDGRHAHLIPYKTECTLIVDYKGLVQLAYRSDEIASIHADVFCEGEQFSENLGRVEKHVIDRSKPRGKPLGAYCIVRFKNGSEKHEVMGAGEIETIRKRSRAGSSGPWVSDWSEMAKKTVFRRASKWLPLAAEVLEAFDRDDDRIIEVQATRTQAKSFAEVVDRLDVQPAESLEDVLGALRQHKERDAVIAFAREQIARHPQYEEAIDREATVMLEGME